MAPWHADVDRQYSSFVTERTRSPSRPSRFSLQPLFSLFSVARLYDGTSMTRPRNAVGDFCPSLSLLSFTHCETHRSLLKRASKPKVGSGSWTAVRPRPCSTYDRRYTKQLRSGVKADRLAYLQGLVDNVALQDLRNPAALYAAVRKAFPAARSSRRSGLRPLPAVIL